MYSLLVLAALSMCDGTSLGYHYEDIATKTKIELSPVQITCSPNDIVVLATPVVNCNDALYRLHKPNGDVIKIDFSQPKSKIHRFYNTISLHPDDYKLRESNLIVKYVNKNIKTVYPKQMYKIIKIDNSDDKRDDDTISVEEKHMNENDFIIGPLLEEDHGNWVLSIYCSDIDGEWIEMFQVISITLISSVPMVESKVRLKEGSTFNLSFMYPVKELESCELTAPPGSPDRYFDRSRIELDRCGYIVPNISRPDQGTWRVIGVGRSVYEGEVTLHVTDDKSLS